MTFDLDHIILYLFLLFIFYLSGRNVSVGKNYWIWIIVCIIFYTLISGSRYGRGNDYFSYIRSYSYIRAEKDFGFFYINSVMKSFAVSSFQIFYVYAFITITGGMLFLRRYRKYAIYMFPAFLLAIFISAEYQVRQSLSYAFVFLYLTQLFRIRANSISDIFKVRNHITILNAVIFAGLTISIHSANSLNILLLTVLYLFIRYPVPYYISIPSVIISSYIIPRIYDVSMVEPILGLIGEQNENLTGYVDNQERWFGTNAYSTDVAENPVIKLFEVLGNVSLLYFGRKVILLKSNNQESITMYNFFFIGTCIVMAFKLMEIAARVGNNMRVFWFYPLAMVLYYRKCLIEKKWEKYLFLFLLFWIYAFFKFLFMSEMTLFLWDRI